MIKSTSPTAIVRMPPGNMMKEKKQTPNVERLRRYMADEARRLGKCGSVIHRINLDEVEEESNGKNASCPGDPLERDLDLLFRNPTNPRR